MVAASNAVITPRQITMGLMLCAVLLAAELACTTNQTDMRPSKATTQGAKVITEILKTHFIACLT